MKIHWVWTAILILFIVALNIWGFCYFKEESSKVAIIGLSGVILAAITSVFTVVINNSETKKRELEFLIIKEKQKVYSIFYDILFQALRQSRDPKVKKLSADDYLEFKKGIMNWGSENLIKEFIDYDSKITQVNLGEDPRKIIDHAEKFLKAIRKDLGLITSKNTNVIEVILDNESRRKIKSKVRIDLDPSSLS